MANPWIDAPIISIPIPACLRCGSAEYRPVKGWKNDDGSKVSRRVCKKCRERYIVRRPALTPKLGSDNSK